jgi:dihydroorotase
LCKPDDWHLHVRDGAALAAVLPHTAARFARAIIMPNLKPPITTTAQAIDYRRRILAARPAGNDFQPLMTLYLTDRTDPDEVDRAKSSGIIHGFKLYPAGATTNSAEGITDIRRIAPVLERMSATGTILQVHGEVTTDSVDVFEREARFIDQVLAPLAQDFPALRIVFEHISTAAAARFVAAGHPRIAATITPQHLMLNRNALFAGGLRPHHYCLPVLKTEPDRLALLEAATSGSPAFFLGTDSAPHARSAKEHSHGCAGIYSAHAALELYAEVFEEAGALAMLQGFASEFGADFYGLPRNTERITLTRTPWEVPTSFAFGQDELIPWRAGERIRWRLQSPA